MRKEIDKSFAASHLFAPHGRIALFLVMMGDKAVVPTKCDACGAERELVRSGERTAARCDSCGKVEDVDIVCAAQKKWTVVEPDGVVRSYASREAVVAALQAPVAKKNEIEDDVLSVRDLEVIAVPPLPATARTSRAPAAPSGPPPPLPPPKARILTTLAPPSRHDKPAPPPPSIDAPVIDTPAPAAAAAAPATTPMPAKTKEGNEGNEDAPSKAPPKPPARPEVATAKDVVPSTPPRAKDEAEAPKRGWFLPVAAVAVVAGSVAFAFRGAPANETTAPTAADAAAVDVKASSSSSASPAAAASAMASGAPSSSAAATASGAPASSGASSSSASSNASASASTTAPPDKATAADPGAKTTAAGGGGAAGGAAGDSPAVALGSLPLSELLTRGSAARRSGDNARARALLERALVVSPGNVEALSGLADMARGTGDLAGAKASYERALATSPGFSPALLGLADTEWDLGDRASAQRHYRTLVANGGSAPERAKTRATGATGPSGPATTSTTTTPANTVRPITSADLPPPAAPAPKP